MSPKTKKIIYWASTILFAAFMIFSGASPLFSPQSSIDVMVHLGYPVYLLWILGVCKVLGAIAIVQTKWKTIKEWAYAGFVFDIGGAGVSLAIVDGIGVALTVLPFLIVLGISYYFWKREQQGKRF